jgi:hypothetical protein
MRSRTSTAVVLNIALVALSTFYFLAPTVYTFFSEAQLSYANVPKWFATTEPARITAMFFDRYNATAPRAARFQRQLSCFLIDEGATRLPGCLHEIKTGQVVHGPPLLKIASGGYVAHFEFSENNVCSDGVVRLQVATAGKFGRVLADYSGHITPGQVIDLPFQLKLMDAALGAVEFRATSLDRCVLLKRAGWTPPITAG